MQSQMSGMRAEDPATKEYRLKMVALLDKMEANKHQTVPSAALQADIDSKFDEFMDREYADDQIGELDEDEVVNENKVSEALILGAVDDFIEDKKMWFRDLYHKHGDYTEKDHVVVLAKNSE
jgi:hypothetical protein